MKRNEIIQTDSNILDMNSTRRNFLRLAGGAFAATITRDTLFQSRAEAKSNIKQERIKTPAKNLEAKKFSYPTAEQIQSLNILAAEAKEDRKILLNVRLVVDKSEQKIYLYKNTKPGQPDNELVAEFPTSTGRPYLINGKTVDFTNKELESEIEYVQDNPTDNESIIGFWAPFQNYAKMTIGFHIIPKKLEKNIGKPDSHGCIRLREQDGLLIRPLLAKEVQVRIQN